VNAVSSPRDLVARIEARPTLPGGSEERFAGYGVMGLPFRSGHILALRCFPASSVGPPYRAVWHRDPAGRWTFFQDVPPMQGCARYFGAALAEVVAATIDVAWDGPTQLSATVNGGGRSLEWRATLTSSVMTRVMSRVGSLLPETLWQQPLLLGGMGVVAGKMMGAGAIHLRGLTPNGQRFVANPLRLWLVDDSEAVLDGVDLGAVGSSPTPGRLRDFWIPRRGVFAIGRSFFTAPAASDSDAESAVTMLDPS
jgi:hypothetical protein